MCYGACKQHASHLQDSGSRLCGWLRATVTWPEPSSISSTGTVATEPSARRRRTVWHRAAGVDRLRLSNLAKQKQRSAAIG